MNCGNTKRGWCRKCGVSAQLGSSWPPPALRRQCAGTMSERCSISGREVAKPPSHSIADDGAVSFAALKANGAFLVETPVAPPLTANVALSHVAGGNTAIVGDYPLEMVVDHWDVLKEQTGTRRRRIHSGTETWALITRRWVARPRRQLSVPHR